MGLVIQMKVYHRVGDACNAKRLQANLLLAPLAAFSLSE